MQTNYTKLVEIYAPKKFRKAQKIFDTPRAVHLTAFINQFNFCRSAWAWILVLCFGSWNVGTLETRLTNSVT